MISSFLSLGRMRLGDDVLEDLTKFFLLFGVTNRLQLLEMLEDVLLPGGFPLPDLLGH